MRTATIGVFAVTMALSVLAAGCGGESRVDRTAPDPFLAVQSRARADDREARTRAAPRWERIRVIRGSGPGVHPVDIDHDAIQWRLSWDCAGARFAVAANGRDLGHGDCSHRRTSSGRGRRRIDLAVRAAGRWRLTIEQQVTTPLHEPPLPASLGRGSQVVARGLFRPVERRGSGRATITRLADGRLVLRLAAFSTSANTDLAVWLSGARSPRTTRQVLAARHVRVASLKASAGDQNYALPRTVRLARVQSIVIWCEPVRIAYTMAPLSRRPR